MRKLSSLIEAFLKTNTPVLTSDTLCVKEQRLRFNQRQKMLNAQLPEYPLTIQDETLHLDVGAVPIRVYQPKIAPTATTLVFFHGGGFVYGDLDTLEAFCREIASNTHCTLISVDYPLAPEQPFPAAPETLFAATTWIYKHLNRWRGSSERFFIGGSSAGATLAAVVSQMIGQRGGATISGQVLLCPMTDTNFDTSSYKENAQGFNLTREQCLWFVSQYVQDPSQLSNPIVAPLRATDFSKYPSSLIVTAEFDPVRDDGIAFAQKLQAAGIACNHHCYAGMIHGFFTLPLQLNETKKVFADLKAFLANSC